MTTFQINQVDDQTWHGIVENRGKRYLCTYLTCVAPVETQVQKDWKNHRDWFRKTTVEGEALMRAAVAIMYLEDPPTIDTVTDMDKALHVIGLGSLDPFWVRWGHFLHCRGVV